MPRRRSLPVIAPIWNRCPPRQPCVRVCRYSVLFEVTPTGSIAINGGPTLAPVRDKRGMITDAHVEAAADAAVRRARELRVTCAWHYVRPHGMTQAEVAEVLAVEHQRVDQIEHEACAVVASALLAETRGEIEPHEWTERNAA